MSYLVACVPATSCPQEPAQIHAALPTLVLASMAKGNGFCPCLREFVSHPRSKKAQRCEQETAKETVAIGFQKR